MDINYKSARFDYLDTYFEVDTFIKYLKEKEAKAKERGWIDLKVEIEQQDYSDNYSLYLIGKRPKTQEELNKEARERTEHEAYELKQYKALKAKFEGK